MPGSVVIGSLEFNLVDLSVEIGEDYPCSWFPTLPFRATTVMDFEPWGFPTFLRALSLDEHTGTHFDAPRHFVHDSPSVSESVPLEAFVGPACVIDIPSAEAALGHSPILGTDVLRDHERDSGRIPARSIALLRTRWSEDKYRRWPKGAAYLADVVAGRSAGWSSPSPALVEQLADRGVRAIGIDAPTIGAIHDSAPAHLAALSRGVLPIENLTNLSRLPNRGATFLFLPLRILGGSGSPGRAIALIPS